MSDYEINIRINADSSGATQAFEDVAQAASQMGSEVQGAASDVQGASRSLDQIGQSADQAGRKLESTGKSVGSAASALAGLASAGASISGLVRSFDQIENSSHRAERAQHALERANIAVTKAQQELAQAIAQFGPNSQQAAAAAQKLQTELDKQADAANKASDATENFGFAVSSAVTNLINFAAGITTIASNLGGLKTVFSAVVRGFEGLGDAVITAASGLGTLGGNLRAMGFAAVAAGFAILGINEALKAMDIQNQKTLISFEDFNNAVRNIPGIGPIIADNVQKLADMQHQSDETADSTDSTSTALDLLKQSASGTGQSMGQAASGIDQAGNSAQTAAEKLHSLEKSADFHVEPEVDTRKLDLAFHQTAKDIEEFERRNPTLYIGADGSAYFRESDAVKQDEQKLPDNHVTTMEANTFKFTGPVNEANTAIRAIPDDKNTMVTANGMPLVQAGAEAIAKAFAPPLYPDSKNTLVTANGMPLVQAGAEAIGRAFSAPQYPDNKNTLVTANGMPLVQAGAEAIGQAFAAPRYPDNKNTLVAASGMPLVQAGAEAIGKAFSAPRYPDNKNTQVSETGGSLVEAAAKEIARAFGLIPDNKKSQVDAETREANRNLDETKRKIDDIKDKTVTIRVNATGSGVGMAGAGGSGTGGVRRRHGGSDFVTSPTRFSVGEGFHPEYVSRTPVHMAAHGFNGFVNKPTFFVAGEAGPELVNVIPLQGGAGPMAAMMGGMGGGAGSEQMMGMVKQMIESMDLDGILSMAKEIVQDVMTAVQSIGTKMLALIGKMQQGLANISSMGGGAGMGGGGGSGGLGGGFGGGGIDLGGIGGAAKGFDGLVKKPTLILVGEAGPELVNVIPLARGTSNNNGGSGNLDRLIDSIDKLASAQRRGGGFNANLFVDGEKMATAASKYIGNKSYGDL